MAVQNKLATRNKTGITAFLSNENVKNQINNALGELNSQRFVTSVISAVNTNAALAECTNQSILSAALLGETLKLSPSPQLGYYYMVPFNDKEKGKVAQFQLGYKGYVQLAIRSGEYKKLNVIAVKKGELEYFDPLNEEIKINMMVDNWDEREAAETIGYYAYFELTNGFKKSLYWSKKQMEAHAMKYSKGYAAKKGYTFWEKNFDGMAFKTMLRQLISKWGIMSIDLQRAMEDDMTFTDNNGNRTYTEPVDEIVYEADPAEVKEETTKEDVAAVVTEDSAADALFG